MNRFARIAVGLLLAGAITPATFADPEPAPKPQSQAAPALFDPSRHMRVSEVRPGMKGYGLSVFSGTKIERFDVEVISILRNFNPKGDVILIKCRGANLELTGAVAGMSGSPVYLKDESGRERMIGAFAYGWPMTKEPIAGVQPIEYMLNIPTEKKPDAPVEAGPGGMTLPNRTEAGTRDSVPEPGTRLSWSPVEAFGWPNPKLLQQAQSRPMLTDARAPGNRLGSDVADAAKLRPLATPLMAGGVSQKILDQFAPLFTAAGLVPLQAGGGGSDDSSPSREGQAAIEPGAVLAVPLLTGDSDMTAIGTCTEVLGRRVFGFGHPFQNEGAVVLPMGVGKISSIIPNLMTSFKLGSLTAPLGTLTADQNFGVAGQLGASPALVPIDVRIVYTDGSQDRAYHFDSALHPKFTPLLSGVALASAVSGTNDLPQYNTVEYDVTLEFKNGQTVHLNNTSVNANPLTLFTEMAMPMMSASDNPFERVLLKKVSGTIKVTPEARDAQILEVNVPKSRYRPGDTIKAFVTYKPFRATEQIMPVELDIPRDLPEGPYQLVFCDWTRYATDEQASKPFRFAAEKVQDVFDVLKDVSSIKHNALYVRLVRQPDGVAIGRTAMPHLPSSRRQIMIGAGRSNTTKYVSSIVKVVPSKQVFTGAADFAITVDRDLKVETGRAGPPALQPTLPGSPTPTPSPSPVVPGAAPRPGPGPSPAPGPGPSPGPSPGVPGSGTGPAD
jgi:hypothetical protein